MSRFHETYRSIPPATLVAIGLCTTLFLIQEITFLPRLEYVTLCPRLVLYQGEVHRMLTSSLYHANWMHIGMNLLSTAAVGGILEKRLGTMRMFATILISLLVTPLLYISAALFLDLALGSKELMNKHAVGFSGIIFQLSVLECNLGPQDANRTLFGMFQVPAYLYPWALLVALQIFIPNLSFEGHLSGIIAGLLQLYGMLDGIMPSEGSFRQMDDTSNLRCLSSMSSFAVTTNTQYVRFESQWLRRLHNNSSRTLCSCIGFAGDVIAESTVSVFQRVRSLRSSIPVDAASSVDLDEEEEDWCGLPSKLETTRLTTSEII